MELGAGEPNEILSVLILKFITQYEAGSCWWNEYVLECTGMYWNEGHKCTGAYCTNVEASTTGGKGCAGRPMSGLMYHLLTG